MIYLYVYDSFFMFLYFYPIMLRELCKMCCSSMWCPLCLIHLSNFTHHLLSSVLYFVWNRNFVNLLVCFRAAVIIFGLCSMLVHECNVLIVCDILGKGDSSEWLEGWSSGGILHRSVCMIVETVHKLWIETWVVHKVNRRGSTRLGIWFLYMIGYGIETLIGPDTDNGF